MCTLMYTCILFGHFTGKCFACHFWLYTSFCKWTSSNFMSYGSFSYGFICSGLCSSEAILTMMHLMLACFLDFLVKSFKFKMLIFGLWEEASFIHCYLEIFITLCKYIKKPFRLIHVNIWQKPLQYYKVISFQLINK